MRQHARRTTAASPYSVIAAVVQPPSCLESLDVMPAGLVVVEMGAEKMVYSLVC